MLNDHENTYLAKWLNNELTPQEIEELKQLPEYPEYEKIIRGLEHFQAPSFDTQKSLEATLERLEQPQKKKVISLRPLWYAVAVAASLLLVLGIVFNTVNYATAPGQQLAISLPDGSKVNLNAGSSLSHGRFSWMFDRSVKLEGEAYFEVIKGNTFSVASTTGEVQVLGTKFNVKDRERLFSVACYEGKVAVEAKGKTVTLTKNEFVVLQDQQLNKNTDNQEVPSWLKGESRFENVPLKEVLDELERQFGATFYRNGIDQSKLFTGGFKYDDLNVALQSVLVPMEVTYEVSGTNITLIP